MLEMTYKIFADQGDPGAPRRGSGSLGEETPGPGGTSADSSRCAGWRGADREPSSASMPQPA